MSPIKKSAAALWRPLGRGGGGARRGPAIESNPALEMIWQAVGGLPRGRVTSYGAVASACGLPGRARLVGYALRSAPEGLNLPWHRVLGAGGRIVFPPGSREYREQARRLKAEGVPVRAGRVPAAFLSALEEF